MHIAIDARRIADFGVGTYIRNLVRMLARQDRTNRYLLVEGPDPAPDRPEALPENFARVIFRPSDQSLRNHLQFQFLLYGIALVLMMLYRPEGLFPSQTRRRELHEAMDTPDDPEVLGALGEVPGAEEQFGESSGEGVR